MRTQLIIAAGLGLALALPAVAEAESAGAPATAVAGWQKPGKERPTAAAQQRKSGADAGPAQKRQAGADRAQRGGTPADVAAQQGGGQSARPGKADRGAQVQRQGQPQRGQGQSARGAGAGRGQGGAARGQDPRERGSAQAQGRGAGQGRGGSAAAPGQGRGRSDDVAAGRGRGTGGVKGDERGGGRRDVAARVRSLPAELRGLARSERFSDRLVVSAAALGAARGLRPDELRVRRMDERIQLLNRDGDLLFDMDEYRARDIGAWDMRMLGDQRPRGNAPAFCRSGAGHPVHGREWCLDKGFGLGSADGWLWSRRDVDDIIYRRRVDQDRYDRGGLIGVLGDIVFGRLALHALTLGFGEPLVGYRVAEPDAPRLLRIRSGDYEVAEFVDVDGDDRVDVMYVTQYVY